jgi:hypothetical protein
VIETLSGFFLKQQRAKGPTLYTLKIILFQTSIWELSKERRDHCDRVPCAEEQWHSANLTSVSQPRAFPAVKQCMHGQRYCKRRRDHKAVLAYNVLQCLSGGQPRQDPDPHPDPWLTQAYAFKKPWCLTLSSLEACFLFGSKGSHIEHSAANMGIWEKQKMSVPRLLWHTIFRHMREPSWYTACQYFTVTEKNYIFTIAFSFLVFVYYLFGFFVSVFFFILQTQNIWWGEWVSQPHFGPKEWKYRQWMEECQSSRALMSLSAASLLHLPAQSYLWLTFLTSFVGASATMIKHLLLCHLVFLYPLCLA